MTEKPVARHNAVGLLIDVVVLGATAVALFIALTGGSTYSIAGHVVRLQTPGNPFVVIAFLLVVRYVWVADVRFLLIGSAPRVAIDSLVRRMVVLLRAEASTKGQQAIAAVWLVAAVSLALRLTNAVSHPGFLTGDDIEIHEMTFNALFGRHWPIWELRSPLYPMVFIYPVQRLLLATGETGTAALVAGARAWVALMSTAMIWLVYAATMKVARGQVTALIAAVLFAVSHLYLSLASSELPQPIAAIFVLAAFCLLLDRGAARAAFAGALLGVGGSLRFGEFVFFVPAVAQLAFERRRSELVIVLASGALAAAVSLGVADWAYWGAPFFSLQHMLDFTLVQQQSSRGFQPPWYYVLNTDHWTNPVFIAASLYSLTTSEKRPALWGWAAIAALSALPHKESRYVIAALPFICISTALAIRDIALRRAVPRLTAVTILLLALAAGYEVSGWHARRTDSAVAVARQVADDHPRSVAAQQAWQFGDRLYWRDVPVVIDLTAFPSIPLQDVEVVVLSRAGTTRDELALYDQRGFSPTNKSTADYIVLSRRTRGSRS
jgi:hypothetical protein